MTKSTCLRCNAEVKQHASKCWNCGNVSPTYSGKKKAILFIGCLLAFSFGMSTCDNKDNLKTHHSYSDSNHDETSLSAVNNATETTTPKWYKHGSLQNENALVWQQSSHTKKLSTAANIYAEFWLNKTLSPNVMNQIKNMDDLKPFAEKLVTELDSAFKPAPTDKENKMIFSNQKISETAVLILMMNNQLIKK